MSAKSKFSRLQGALAAVDAELLRVERKNLLDAVADRLGSWGVEVLAMTNEPLLAELDLAAELPKRRECLVIEPPTRDMTAEQLRFWRDKVAGAEAGVTSAVAIAAETGTLLLPPLVPDQRAVSLLPDKHLVLLPSARIVETIDDLFALGVQENRFAGNAVFVTGPSRTADIEKELVLGVHGPRALTVLLIDG